MHAALVAYVLVAMMSWIPPHPSQLAEYRQIAEAIVDATDDPEDEIQLASIASYESRFSIRARGKLGEVGAFQLLGRAPRTVRGQAVEALRRWKQQGRCGYTGEASKAPDCPLATRRYLRAFEWSYAHPFVSGAS
jgi:hypothetical protein